MQVRNLIEEGISYLIRQNIGREEAKSCVKALISHAIKIDYAAILLNQDKIVNIEHQILLAEMLRRHGENKEPIQYIINEWDFYNLKKIKCRKPILIPRPETEQLVENIVHHYKARPPSHFIDIGTGTGAIALALLKAWPLSTCTAIDINPLAVKLTKENALFFGLEKNIKIVESALNQYQPLKDIEMIVSNPPYIPTHEMSTLDQQVKSYESHVALDGGIDGLDVIKEILAFANSNHKVKRKTQVFLEVDLTHPSILSSSSFFKGKYENMRHLKNIKDFANRERFVVLEKK